MKKLYLLVADKSWAKLYKCDDAPARPSLIYHQRNWAGNSSDLYKLPSPATIRNGPLARPEGEDLARGLCKIIKADFQAHKFHVLFVFGSEVFIELLERHLDSQCRSVVFGEVVPNPGLLTSSGLATSLHHLVRTRLLLPVSA